MNYVFFDTNILNKIVYTSVNSDSIALKNRWDMFITEINKYIPSPFEKFQLVETDLLFLEIIGLGSIKEESFKSLVSQIDWRQFYPDEEVKFINYVADAIDNQIENQWNSRVLYRKILDFEKKYICHEHSHFLFARIKSWRKNIKKKEYYERMKYHLLWNVLSTYPFITDTKPLEENLANFWVKILGCLTREYYEFSKDQHIEFSALGVFSELHRIGKFWHDASSKPILELWKDMVDAEAIHYALIGKNVRPGLNEPVIVVTGDKRSIVERRLESMYKNLIDINNIFKKNEKELTINFCPGIIICVTFSVDLSQITCEIIKVCDYIKSLT